MKKKHRVSRRSGFENTSLTMKTKLQSEFDVPSTNNPHDACCKNDKEDGGAMFVEWWDISLRWGFDDLLPPLRYHHRVGGVTNYE